MQEAKKPTEHYFYKGGIQYCNSCMQPEDYDNDIDECICEDSDKPQRLEDCLGELCWCDWLKRPCLKDKFKHLKAPDSKVLIDDVVESYEAEGQKIERVDIQNGKRYKITFEQIAKFFKVWNYEVITCFNADGTFKCKVFVGSSRIGQGLYAAWFDQGLFITLEDVTWPKITGTCSARLIEQTQ